LSALSCHRQIQLSWHPGLAPELYLLSTINASVRSRRGLGGPCSRIDTSGQTWLTAARTETHQNLIYTSKDHSSHAFHRQRPPNSNSKPPDAMRSACRADH